MNAAPDAWHDAPMEIHFLGGATTVTGSQFLLVTDRARILIDCGMFQGGPNESVRNRVPLAFDPKTLDAILLTHAHLDHCGLIPHVVAEGFAGPVYATSATVRAGGARPARLRPSPGGVREARGPLGAAPPGRGGRRRPKELDGVPGRGEARRGGRGARCGRRHAGAADLNVWRRDRRDPPSRPTPRRSRRRRRPRRPRSPPTSAPGSARGSPRASPSTTSTTSGASRRTSISTSTSRSTRSTTRRRRWSTSARSTTTPRSRSRRGSGPCSRTPATSWARR